MSQLHAGYLFDSVTSLFEKEYFKANLLPLIKQLSYFDAETKTSLDTKKTHPQASVIHNIITRGRPSKPSAYIEELFSLYIKRTEKEIHSEKINFPFNDTELKKELEAAFYPTDPGIEIKIRKPKGEHEAFNNKIIDKFTNTHMHRAYNRFFVKNNKPLSRIIPDTYTELTEDEYLTAKVIPDFILDLPKAYRGIKGLIIETDHETGAAGMDYLAIEKKRKLSEKFQYKYIYAKNGNLDEALIEFESFTFNDYFDQLRKNYDIPLYSKTSGKDAMQYILSPIAIARVQKVILEFILAEKINPEAKLWKIAVIERDVPAAYTAIEDLKRLYNLLCNLQGVSKQFPHTEIDIYTSPEFEDAKLHKACKKNTLLIENFNNKKEYDLLIDLSVLQNTVESCKIPRNSAKHSIKVRSCNHKHSNHQFYFGSSLSFYSSEELTDTSRKKMINSFIQNTLRQPKLDNFELNAALKNLLGEKSVILESAGNSLRSADLIYSLLNPGISVHIFPNNISLQDRFQEIRETGIQASFYLNSIQHRLRDKNKVAEQLKNKEALILLVNVDFIRTETFQSIISEMKENTINFSGVFIEDVTAVSEFSSGFNPEYKGLATLSGSIFKSKGFGLPIFARGMHSDYAVIEDIKADTGIDLLSEKKAEIPKFDTNVIQNKITGISDKGIILRKVVEAKHTALKEIIKKLPEKEKLLIVYPFKENENGTYSQNLQDSHKKLTEKFTELDICNFTETASFERANFNTEDYIISSKNYKKFKTGECQILTATELISYGASIPDLRQIVVYNMLPNAEELYRLIGKFGKKAKTPILHILNDKSEFEIKEISDAATEDGKSELMEQIVKTTSDLFVRGQKTKLRFAGRKKEKTIPEELLKNINIPEKNPAEELEKAIYNQFEIETEIYALPEDNPTKVYAGKGKKAYGYYNFKTKLTNIENTAFSKKIAGQVVNFIKNEVVKYSENLNTDLKNFNSSASEKNIPGIESEFKEMKTGEAKSISLYTYNNAAARTIRLLQEHSKYNLDYTELLQILKTSDSENEFISILKRRCNINVINQSIDLPAELKKLFTEHRTDFQTFLAISRLLEQGIIDDYTIDRHNKSLTVFFTKRTNIYYKNKLKDFLSRYLAIEKADEVFNEVENYSGTSLIRKILNFVLNFTYNEIKERHEENAEQMAVWADELAKTDNEDTRRAELNNYMLSVFKAKYLNPLSKPSLITETDNFETGDFNTVMSFIYRAEYLKSRIEHLYLSSEKAQKIHPDNYIILLLNGFARFRRQKNNSEFDKAFNRLYIGFTNMQQSEELSYDETISRKQLFLELLYKYNHELKEKTDPLIYLKTHTEKLTEFNNKFLKGFRT